MFCYLNRSTSSSIEFNCIASSLLSGVGYAFFPRYIVITLAITTAIESIYKCYVKKISETRDKLPKIVEIMKKVPVLPLIFIFSLGMNLQLRFFYPSLINKFMYKISFSATNGHADAIAHRVVGKMMGYDWNKQWLLNSRYKLNMFKHERFFYIFKLFKETNWRKKIETFWKISWM